MVDDHHTYLGLDLRLISAKLSSSVCVPIAATDTAKLRHPENDHRPAIYADHHAGNIL